MEQMKIQQAEGKLEADTVIAGLEQELKAQGVQLDEAKAASSLEFDYTKLETDDATKRIQIEANHSLGMSKLEFEAGKQMDADRQQTADRQTDSVKTVAQFQHDEEMRDRATDNQEAKDDGAT